MHNITEDDDDLLGISEADITEAERRLREVMDQQQINFSVTADWATADKEEPVASTISMNDIIADAIEDDADEEDNLNAANALPTLPATDCLAPQPQTEDIPTLQEAVRCMEKDLRYLEKGLNTDEMEPIQMKSLFSLTKGQLQPKQAQPTDYFSCRNNSDWFPCDASIELFLE